VSYSLFSGFAHLSAGLVVGFSALASGVSIGIAGDAGVRSAAAGRFSPAKQVKMYVGMVLILGFAGALGLYGLIVALIMTSNTSEACGMARVSSKS
jgi:V-type H+-transporting ATPase proteolipid subunit